MLHEINIREHMWNILTTHSNNEDTILCSLFYSPSPSSPFTMSLKMNSHSLCQFLFQFIINRERVRESREDAEKRAAHNLINIFMLIGDSHSAQEVNTLTHTHMQLQAPFTVNLPTRGRAFINSNALKGQKKKKRKHITALLMW